MTPLIPINNTQKTKIIATIGPASSSTEALVSLIQAGVNIFRLNFSHGAHQVHKDTIDRIIDINHKYNTHVGILADLQGPKLRVGKIENNELLLSQGDVLTFTNEECLGTREKIYMSYELFAQDVNVGEKVLVDDGKVVLEVIETDKKSTVKLIVLYGNVLSSNKGVNLPDTKVSQPSLTEKDLEDLEFILTQPVHWIALSFVREAKDIVDLKRRIKDKNHFAKVIAKVEKPEAITNIKDIVKVSDAIMIARGDLGVEMAMEKLPALQKTIIDRCVKRAKPVIVATQMMESMITNPSPSRAEITDVANAVLDGADAVMLSGETSVGAHPSLVVEAMRKIIGEAEAHFHMHGTRPEPNPDKETFFSDTVCINAAKVAEDINAKAILGLTVNGYTAFKISSYRAKPQIHIFSDQEHMLNTLSLVWGVQGHLYQKFTTTDETIEDVNQILVDEGIIETGDVVVNTGSMPLYKRFRTNMLKITIIE